MDDVLCRRIVSLDELMAAPGGRRLQAVLEAWTPGALPGSVAEIKLVRALIAAGLAAPVRQYVIEEAHARVDLAYVWARLAIELDSFRWHGGRRPFQSDRSRGNRIVAAGWHLLRATPEDFGTTVKAARRLVCTAAA